MQTELNGQNLSLEEQMEFLKKENASLKSGNPIQTLLDGLGVKSPANKMQCHGQTVAQMEERRIRQASGGERKFVTATDGKTQIFESEKHLVHVYLESVLFSDKGKKISPPGHIAKFYPNDFSLMTKDPERNYLGQFDIITIVNDPRIGAENKSVSKVSEEGNLRVKYKEIYGEDAPVNATVEQLTSAVNEAV